MRSLPNLMIEPVVRLALAEDLGRAGDMTAMACIPQGARMRAAFAARKAGVLAGINCVRLAVRAMDPAASIDLRLRDGDAVEIVTLVGGGSPADAPPPDAPDAGLEEAPSRGEDRDGSSGAPRPLGAADGGRAGAGAHGDARPQCPRGRRE